MTDQSVDLVGGSASNFAGAASNFFSRNRLKSMFQRFSLNISAFVSGYGGLRTFV
jgi:hypothetical protein